MSILETVRGNLAALAVAQRKAPEKELLAKWMEFADLLTLHKHSLGVQTIRRGMWRYVDLHAFYCTLTDQIADCMLDVSEHGRVKGLLSALWISPSNQGEVGYLVRVAGCHYSISAFRATLDE